MDSVKELLSDPLKGQKRAQGILCYLFRNVLLWKEVNMIKWNKRLNLYFQKPHNKDKPVDKGNLNKCLIADDMTWGSFMKAIDFLSPVAATLTIKLTWRDGRMSEYVISLDPAEDESDPKLNTFISKEEVGDIFAQQKKPVNTLARLFRYIVRQEQLDVPKWNHLFEEYVKNPLNGVDHNKRDLAATISQLQRSMLDKRMTWNTFRRGLQVLNPIHEQFTLSMRWTNDPRLEKLDPSKVVTEHTASYRDPFATGTVHESQ